MQNLLGLADSLFLLIYSITVYFRYIRFLTVLNNLQELFDLFVTG